MKRSTLGILALILILVASCKKNTDSAGSWTFKGITYYANKCSWQGNILEATTVNQTDTGVVAIEFGTATPPTVSGTYTVSNYYPTTNQVIVYVATGGNNINYNSLGCTENNQIVHVVVSNGKVSISGSGIEVKNDTLASDSATVSFNITQTQ